MSQKTTGLTLGKFAPLHRGHQHVIETALAETDRLIVLIYDCPEVTHVPLTVRAGWIRELYPNAEVIEAWDGPLEVGDTPEIKRMHEKYILRILDGERITHFYSSEFYGEHVSRALGAVNRQVDAAREQFRISGTLLRGNAYEYRKFIHPRVYRDLIANIVFLGAPSTGKTTIAKAMAQEFDTVWMPEYGREYWEEHQENRRLTLEQLAEIAEGHRLREEAKLCQANRYLFTDTNALTTYVFSRYYHGRAHEKLIRHANAATRRYDLVFLCDTDIPYDETWDRSGEGNRQVLQARTKSELAERNIPYLTLRGSVQDRIDCVMRVILRFQKYRNVLDVVSGITGL